MASEHFKYCLDQLKRFDHDRYLAILLTPEKHQAALCALYAFNVEMARIPQAVSEPMLGEIRFQWWHETLESLTPARAPGHEIAEALGNSLFDGPVAPVDLLPLITAHKQALAETAPPDLAALVEDVRTREGLLDELAWRIVGGQGGLATGFPQLVKLSLAYGLVNHIRGLPQAAAQQRLTLPIDLMAQFDIDPHDIFAGTYRPAMHHAISEILQASQILYEEGHSGGKVLTRDQLTAFLPASLTPLYLANLGKAGFNHLRTSSEIPSFRRQLRLLRVSWTGRL